MSHTVVKVAGPVSNEGRYTTYTKLSTLTAGSNEDVAHGGHSGTEPEEVRMQVVTAPTDGSPLELEYDKANNDTSNNTARLTFKVPSGGSISGAVVEVYFTFNVAATGGIS